MPGVNTIIKENTCVSFTTMRLDGTQYVDLNANNVRDDGEAVGILFSKPFSNPLMDEVTNGWYIEGPGLGGPGVPGRVQITGLISEDAEDKAITITSNTTYYSLQLVGTYTFYSPGCI